MPEQSMAQERKPDADDGAGRITVARVSEPEGGLPAPGFMPVPGVMGSDDQGLRSLRRRDGARDDAVGGSAVDDAVVGALRRRRGGGSPLPDSIAGPMSAQLKIDASDVRVHADAEAGSMARSVQAAAFTHGNDIYFAPGAYQPSSDAGRRTIAHELSHVAAQRAGTDAASRGRLTVGRSDDPAEAAADRSADRVLTALRRSTAVAPLGGRLDGSESRRAGAGRMFAALRRAPGDEVESSGEEGEEGGGLAVLTKDGNGTQTSDSGPALESGEQPAEESGEPEDSEERRKKRERNQKKNRRRKEQKRKKEVKEYRRNQMRDQMPAAKQKLAQTRAGTALLTTAGKRATEEAGQLNPGPLARGAAEETLWARSLSGGDQTKAQSLLSLRHAVAGPEMVSWLEANADNPAKISFAATNISKFASPFDKARFDLFFDRQADVPLFEDLLKLAPVPWTVPHINAVLAATNDVLSTAEQSGLLGRCKTETWSAAQVLGLAGRLPKDVLIHLGTSATLGKEITERAKAWSFADIGTVMAEFHAKAGSLPEIERFIKASRTCEFTGEESRTLVATCRKEILLGFADPATDLQVQLKDAKAKAAWVEVTKVAELFEAFYAKQPDCAMLAKLVKAFAAIEATLVQARDLVDGCRKEILVGVATEATDLHPQIKEAKVKAAWTDFKKMAALFEAFYAKQPDCTMLAKLVKGCAKYAWTQDNVKLLVDGLKAAPLKDVAETEDFQTKIENVSKKWPDWTELAAAIDTGYDNAMTKTDVGDLLKECTDYHAAGKYEAKHAKAYITTAVQAGGYTWAQRLAQAQKFRTHVQPAGGTNDLGGAANVLGFYDVPPPQGGPYRAEVVLPENKHTHFKDGHSYEAFWFDVGNCHRYGGLSSMWAPGTDIAGRAAAAAGAGLSTQIKNAAWNAGGTQQTTGNYVIAYSYFSQTGPQTYRVAVSQLYPKGGWMHHQLKGFLAEGIGRLRGYIT
ncbi:MAG: hypothetical protein BGO26_18620 [Actinobacteria bacterium 69-20]|nr:MAG: hypothetical protein BGO26_18620 [Actinobacteria bacterium 69-20]